MNANQSAGFEHEHLTWSEIEAFFLRTERPEERRPLYHLLTRCDGCRQAAHPIPEILEEGLVDGRSSWLEIEMAASEWQAPALWDEITADFPADAEPGAEVALLRGDDRWPTWGLCIWLARRSLETPHEEAETALRRARLAHLGATELPPDPPMPAPWVEELRAFTQAAMGDARRRTGNLPGAQDAFHEARRHLEAARDDGDFLPFRPVIFDREAALFDDLGKPKAAVRRLDQALHAWEMVLDPRQVDKARLLRHKARLLRRMHHLEEALDLHEQAAEILTSEVA